MKKGLVFSSIASLGVLFSMNLVSAVWRFGDVLNSWADKDIFTYVLPFLLIFAVVYGILNKSNIFGADAKGVNVIIALALGLLSLVGNYVPEFFQTMIPKLAIGISILLAAIILVGLWIGTSGKGGEWINTGLIIVGAIIFIFVIYSSFSNNYTTIGNVWDNYGNAFVTLLILAAIIALVVFWGKSSSGIPTK